MNFRWKPHPAISPSIVTFFQYFLDKRSFWNIYFDPEKPILENGQSEGNL